METSLIDGWLAQPEMLIIDEAGVVLAREHVRRVGRVAALPIELIETMALVASELVVNQLRHASGGRFSAFVIARDGVAGIEIIAADRGPGLINPPRALSDGDSSTGSLGAGLGAVFRLADEVDVDVRVGEGTCFRVRKFSALRPDARLTAVSPGGPRFRAETGVFGRPCPGERISGDDAAVVREGDTTGIAVADGLGHGPDAREASARAVSALRGSPEAGPEQVVRDADRLLRGTRGATMVVARWDRRAGVVEHAGVGDVGARLECAALDRSLAGQSGTLGVGRLSANVRVDREPVSARDAIIIATDGVTSTGGSVRTAGRHPLLVAHEIVTRFGRPNDDALVVVARFA